MSETKRFRITIVSSHDEFSLDDQIRFVTNPSNGGIATFTGSVREENEGRQVEYLEYDCYEPMARETLRSILEEADDRWSSRGDLRIAAAHRTGRVEVGQPAVLVAVGAPHRAEALEACRYVIDELKGRVALWKKEVFVSGETWVENPEALDGPGGQED